MIFMLIALIVCGILIIIFSRKSHKRVLFLVLGIIVIVIPVILIISQISAFSIGIIGGADGPTSIIVG